METPYNLPKNKPYSAERVKELFQQSGVPVSAWAKANGYNVSKVYQVINGQLRGLRGVSHEISVALGMKLEPKTVTA